MTRFNPLLLMIAAMALLAGIITCGMASFFQVPAAISKGLGFIVGGVLFSIADIIVSQKLEASEGFFRYFANRYNPSSKLFPYWCYGLVIVSGGVILLLNSS